MAGSTAVGRSNAHQVVQNLVPDNARHFEALLACDRVDDHIAMDADKMLRVEDTVFILVNSIRVSGVLIET